MSVAIAAVVIGVAWVVLTAAAAIDTLIERIRR